FTQTRPQAQEAANRAPPPTKLAPRSGRDYLGLQTDQAPKMSQTISDPQTAQAPSDIPRLQVGAKPSSFAPLRRLLPFLGRYPVRLALTLAFLLIAAIASLSIPYFAGNFIDEGFVLENFEVVTSYAWLIILIGAIMAVSA